MAKIKFRDVRLSKLNKKRLDIINEIIREYQRDGYVLTLRQLYYQLVTRDIIPNQQAEYSKLSMLLKEGRMGGIVDWSAIEDRLRQPQKTPSWDSPQDILEACASQYKRDHMDGQSEYLEVWVEKDALSGVLQRATNKYHVPIMVNRGYSSISAMFDAFQRFKENGHDKDRSVTVLYLGDYDPSGLDMIRDIRERILDFAYVSIGLDFEFNIKPIALTREQIDTYNPPPNPAKVTDPRAKDFIMNHGNTSWEVDALRPDVLHKLVEDSILSYIDMEMYNKVLEVEEAEKILLQKLTKLI